MRTRRWSFTDPVYQQAAHRFQLQFYRWAQDQARREVDDDFATLRLIKNGSVYMFLEMAQSMDSKGRLRLLMALTKRAHVKGVELAGEVITAEDKKLIDDYVYHDYLPGRRVLDASFERRGAQRIYRPVSERAVMPKVDRRKLRLAIVEKLRPVVGECSVGKGMNSWWYETKIGSWSLWTYVTAFKKYVHMNYLQRIRCGNIDLSWPISVAQWLGICGGSDWKLRDDSEIEEATGALALVVKKFVDAAPALLHGVRAWSPGYFGTGDERTES